MKNEKCFKLVSPPSPTFLSIHHRLMPPDYIWEYDFEFNVFSIIFVTEGTVYHKNEYINVSASQGDFLVICPNKEKTLHFAKSEGCKYICVNFTFHGDWSLCDKEAEDFKFSDGKKIVEIPFYLKQKGSFNFIEIEKYISKMNVLYISNSDFLSCQLNFDQILKYISLEKETSIGSVPKACLDIIKYIDHYFPHATVQSISKELNYSPDHLGRIFKKYFKTTPKEYISKQQMGYAKQLVEQSNLPIKQISETVGFASFPSFINKYKSFFGETPTKTREKLT